MDKTLFIKPSGALRPAIGGGYVFIPAPLPPASLNWAALMNDLGEALQALGELKGAARRLPNATLLIQPMQRLEAISTSAMEGTYTTLDALVLEEAEIESGNSDTREVANFIRALRKADALLQEGLPITYRLLSETHRILLDGVASARGAYRRPGEYKKEQNMIGGRDIKNARYVPPPPDITPDLMADLERFINERERTSAVDALIDIALVHYQFEAIHPFADGNGRMGRMLITLLAKSWKLVDDLVLYISPELEKCKNEYIDFMFNVSAASAWEEWINFFSRITASSCRRIIGTIDDLIALSEEYHRRAHEASRSSNLHMVIDRLFNLPVITVTQLQKEINITYTAAKNIIKKLEEINILTPIPNKRPMAWKAQHIIEIAQKRL